MSKPETMMIDDVKYVREDSIVKYEEPAGDYVVVRTYSAGVHAGYLVRREGKEVELRDTRRIHHWKNAASLSQLAGEGLSSFEGCRFPAEIHSIILTEAIEVIPCTEKAKNMIKSVPVWKC